MLLPLVVPPLAIATEGRQAFSRDRGDMTAGKSVRISLELPDLASAYAELQNLLISTSELNEFLDELAALAVAVITPVASCGITLRRDGQPMTVAASSPLAREIDELQYGRGMGPCLQAMRTGKMVAVTDLAAENRWGDYPSHAMERGVAGSLSLALTSGSASVGAMNLYTTAAHVFSNAEIAQATAFAGQASGALSLVIRHATQLTVESQLREALASRAVIDQAIGAIMGHRQCSAADAFAFLRETSQQQNVKLHNVAAALIETITGHPPGPPRPFTQRP